MQIPARFGYNGGMPVPVTFMMITPEEIRESLTPVLRGLGVEKALLWGSYARGDAHPGSDIDLIVVVDTDRGRLERNGEYLWSLGNALDKLSPEQPNRYPPDLDLDVFSTAEWEKHAARNSLVYETATTEGVVLYERTGYPTAV